MTQPPPPELAAKRARRVLVMCLAGIGVMVGVSYAAVPLYQAFCAAFGIGGAPRIAAADVAIDPTNSSRQIVVRFDANLAGLNWHFKAPAPVVAKIGEPMRIAYTSRNRTKTASTGRAVFSVAPAQAAYYFVKTECFCFQEQTLAAGEEVDMSVVFHFDPEILDDRELDDLKSVTLSYTFFPVAPQTGEAPANATPSANRNAAL